MINVECAPESNTIYSCCFSFYVICIVTLSFHFALFSLCRSHCFGACIRSIKNYKELLKPIEKLQSSIFQVLCRSSASIWMNENCASSSFSVSVNVFLTQTTVLLQPIQSKSCLSLFVCVRAYWISVLQNDDTKHHLNIDKRNVNKCMWFHL